MSYYLLAPIREESASNQTHMKNNKLILAVTLGGVAFVALTALVLSFRSQVNADTLVGFGSVLALIAVSGVEYRINWKRVFSR